MPHGGKVLYKKQDDTEFVEYDAETGIADNGIYIFKAVDDLGNESSEQTIEINNIDKVAPTLEISGNTETWTNKDVVLTAKTGDDHDATIFYKKSNDAEFTEYEKDVVVTENGTYIFCAVDTLGNTSAEQTVVVDKIDKVAPEQPLANADITGKTNKNVTVTAQFSEDSVLRQYSLDNEIWIPYTDGVVFKENGTVYFRSQDAAGNYSAVIMYEVANIDQTADPEETEYIFISSKYNSKIDGKKQNGIVLKYGVNAFASLDEAGDTTGKTVIQIDSKNSGDYAAEGTVSAVVVVPTVKQNDNSYSYKVSSNAAKTLNITSDTDAEFIRFATVNLTGASVGDISGGKESTSDENKSTVDRKGAVTTTKKSSVSTGSSGKFTAIGGADAGNISNYATVAITASSVYKLTGGSEKVAISSKIVDAAAKDQKTLSNTNEIAASGSVTLKSAAFAGSIENYSNVTLSESAAGDISNVTVKDSRSETATYDDVKGVTRKVTLSHTTNSSGTLKATDSTVGDVTGFATVTLKKVDCDSDFRRVDGDGDSYVTVKETLDVKTAKGVITETYKKTTSTSRSGKFTAENSFIGDVENFSTVKLTGTDAGNIVNETLEKIDKSYNNLWDDPELYGVQDDFQIDFDTNNTHLLSSLEKYSANGSVELNSAVAQAIEGFSKVTLKNNASADSIIALNDGELPTCGSYQKQISDKRTTVAGDYYNGAFTETITVAPAASVALTGSTVKGGIIGYKSVTLKQSETGNIDFGIAYTKKYTESYKKGECTKNTIITYTYNGVLNATDSTVKGDITGYSKVTLTGSSAEDITLNTLAKVVNGEDVKKLTGSVTLKNSDVNDISNFSTLTLENSSAQVVDNVTKITVSKGVNSITSISGTNGKDTVTVNKNAVLTIGEIKLDFTNDKLVNNGTVILSDWVDLNDLTISGKGEFAADAEVLAGHHSDTILNLGETSKNFRGTAYEKADDLLKKAVKMDGDEYNGWLGSWGEADTEFDSVDCLKVKVTTETALTVSGDVDWTLWDKKGKVEFGQMSTLDAGEYIIEIKQDKEKGSLAYSVKLN